MANVSNSLCPEHQQVLTDFETALLSYRAEATTTLRVYYASRLMRWAEDNDRMVWDLDRKDLMTWLSKGVGPSASTTRTAKSTLSVFYQWAEISHHIAVNPTLRMPAMRAPRGVPNPCPEADVIRALNRCTRRKDVLMLMLGEYQGLRAGEIARLHTDDIQGEQIRVHGKGNKIRVIPLHPLVRELATYFPAGYFFPSTENPLGHVLPASIGRRVRWLLGDRAKLNAHSLRHKFGVEALELT
ncbi:MAG TPA: hypothetical protein H9871_09985, partial [Candidatus Nesterenkonia stercoripullorum]|nr:hypothetical protein [Candidatus Nesterenkonia stercoripullorum]